MVTIDDIAVPEAVTAAIEFSVPTGETPVSIVRPPGEGDQRRGRHETHPVTIANGRPLADRFTLDGAGFVFRTHPTAVADFYDDAELRRVYYPEMERLVRAATGASTVLVFDHTRRIDDPQAMAEQKMRGPVRSPHNDFTIASAVQRVRDLLPPAEAEVRLQRRFGSINVWRPIRGPVETAPIAICAYGSIAEGDLIAAERRYDTRIGGTYQLRYNPGQQWYYFPRMTSDEVILLKCYDSLEDGTARWTAHCAFDDPAAPAGAPARESIEIRTLYFYD